MHRKQEQYVWEHCGSNGEERRVSTSPTHGPRNIRVTGASMGRTLATTSPTVKPTSSHPRATEIMTNTTSRFMKRLRRTKAGPLYPDTDDERVISFSTRVILTPYNVPAAVSTTRYPENVKLAAWLTMNKSLRSSTDPTMVSGKPIKASDMANTQLPRLQRAGVFDSRSMPCTRRTHTLMRIREHPNHSTWGVRSSRPVGKAHCVSPMRQQDQRVPHGAATYPRLSSTTPAGVGCLFQCLSTTPG